MSKRQKGKGHKRKKSWHRGAVESKNFKRAMRNLSPTSEAILRDVASSGPQAIRRGPGKRYKGDAV